jgi:hypothetical protein
MALHVDGEHLVKRGVDEVRVELAQSSVEVDDPDAAD